VTAPQLEILAIAVVTAVGCALLGSFLLLRGMAMMSDAISHAILPGIVIAFLVVESLSSPWLLIAAAATGVVTVVLVELLHRSGRVRADAAIGLVFPAMFSLGIILITRVVGNVHLDTDVVLLGELAFAPFDRLVVGGHDLGPRHLYLMGAVAAINLGFVVAFYKELKLATFDPGLAATLGFAPAAIHYALMLLVSITAVGAFDAVGLILVVALMIAPPAAAYLLTGRLARLLWLAALLGAAAAAAGLALALKLDGSIAGAMATCAGLIFAAVYLFAPRQGLLAVLLRRRRQRFEFAQTMLAIHLLQHEGRPEEADEARVDHLHGRHVGWDRAFTARIVDQAVAAQLIARSGNRLALTDRGRRRAAHALAL
jgi:manganese/zinc/iron transport system permease protein